MCVNVDVQMYMDIYACKYVVKERSTDFYPDTCIWIDTYIYIYIHVYTYVYIYIYLYVHVCTHVYIYIYIYTYIYI